MSSSITSSVGLNATNRPHDVKRVQELLNAMAPEQGGPRIKLAVDGVFGNKTATAISHFQLRQFGWADGVIAPVQRTIMRLEQLARENPNNGASDIVRKVITMLEYIVCLPALDPQSGPVVALCQPPLKRLQAAYDDAGAVRPSLRRVAATILPVPPPAIPELPVPVAGLGGGLVFILIAVLLFIIVNRPAVVPKTEEEKLAEREMTELEKLLTTMSMSSAEQVRARVKADAKRIEECSNRQLDKIAPGGKCDTLFALWKPKSNELLRKLTQYLTGGIKFPGLLNAINALLIEHDELLKKLDECLECKKLGL